MDPQQLGAIKAIASPRPPLKDEDPLTPEQWTTLYSIADTIIPKIESSDSAPKDVLGLEPTEYASAIEELMAGQPAGTESKKMHAYLAECASDVPMLREALRRTLSEWLPSDARGGISMILSALNSRTGCLLFTQSVTPFHLQPVHVRQQILQNWSKSYLPPLRAAFKSFSGLFVSLYIKSSTIFKDVIGFPRDPVHGTPGKGFDYSFIQFSTGNELETVETDVVIVGSGCGAGVCAKNVAEAGHRVIVTDRAYHYPAEHLPMTENDGHTHLFDNGGALFSDDGSTVVVSGKAWGGGGTVNWSASLQTQGFVRQEWADEGLSFFTSPEFQNSLDRVCNRMGVSTEFVRHNKTNQVLLEGARRLGYNAKTVPQNTGGKEHYCGYCTMGCGSVEKQGPVVSFLPDAANHGAQFIEGFDAREIIFDQINGKRTAVGVKGTWTSRDSNQGVGGSGRATREVVVKANRVIVSCGTLQSPLLLLRSGLSNPQIGRNLHLHPVLAMLAIFPEKVNPWEGGILTALVDSFQNLDGKGHGAKLEALAMLPSGAIPFLPWYSGPEWKKTVAKYNRMTGYISMARDKGTGQVYPDKVDGRARIAYNPSPLDRKHITEGLLALAKITYVSGAEELFVSQPGVPWFTRTQDPKEDADINDPDFQAWLGLIRKNTMPHPDTVFATAHQMGTCRMGIDKKTSVIGPDGHVWDTENLYIADASTFPSASGVNPMITNMAISDYISRGVAAGLKV